MKLPGHKTKIVCTIGPASESPVVLRRLLRAGMDVARLNFSHGDFAAHARTIRNLRAAGRATGRRVAIMADLPGPKMRIGRIDPEPVELKAGAPFTLTTEDVAGDARRVSVSFGQLPRAVRPGDTLFLNDGYIQLTVARVRGAEVRCTVRVGGELRSRKGLNLPGIDLGISAFTPHDRECLRFALEHGVDAVSQSFVERAADVEAVRRAALALGRRPFIVAKIERSAALEHVEEILDAADGIMIARGDLGVEVPIERIAAVQKRLMRLANQRAKPVITATQMLESMTDNRRPTRAEATDVANAILDGTDCVMLSGESAMGKYPVEAVVMLGRIAAVAEGIRRATTVGQLYEGVDVSARLRPAHLIAIGVEACLERVAPAAVFVPTHGGSTARSVARFRYPVWTVALAGRRETCQHLQFSSGVYPVHEPRDPGDWTPFVRRWVRAHGLTGEVALLTEGPSAKNPETNHRLEVVELRAVGGRGGSPGRRHPALRPGA
ncbi:MAG TPA: pyruvate kinase [bacterium]